MASMATSESGDSIESKKISNASDVQRQTRFPPFELRPAATLTPAEKDKLERHGSIVSAQNALVGFTPSLDGEGPQRKKRAVVAQNTRTGHKKVLEGLRKVIRNVVDSQNAQSSTSFFSFLRKSRQQTLNQDDFKKLVEVAHDAFPPRMDMPVLVCDVTLKGATVYPLELKDIEKCWKKPEGEGIIVRWIHVPLGNGVVHSTIEDMFRHDRPAGRPFRHAGIPGFPFLDLETPHLRDVKELKHMRHVHQELHQLRDLHDHLTKTCFDHDRNKTFGDDITWRLKHLGKVPDYWDTVLADIPLELSETFGSSGGEGPIRPPSLGKGPLDPSVLAENDGPYKDTHLVWAPFRCFHRNDGTLLTMSAATGVNLLHRDFKLHLEQTLLDRLQNPDASVIGSQMRALKVHGAKDWYQLTVEYFLVHLITEIAITPHNMYSGHSAPSLLSALQSRIKDLNKRRFEEWNGKESEKLVKDYISCLDQLRALSASNGRKLAIFENLKKDVKAHEKQDQRAVEKALKEEQKLALERAVSTDQSSVHTRRTSAADTPKDAEEQEEDDDELRGSVDRRIHNKKGTTPTQRIEWAIRIIERDKSLADTLIGETERAMQAFFQLRSIEQNERQINNESRNYAVFIFTGVTVVFLPLSFFCSYYGMNLKGIVDTSNSESYFWKLGGSLTVVIVTFICLFAFGHHYWSERIKEAKIRLKKRRLQYQEKDDIESQAQLRAQVQDKDDMEPQEPPG